jgi:predicted DNA-binding transcriptional regulator AlpA
MSLPLAESTPAKRGRKKRSLPPALLRREAAAEFLALSRPTFDRADAAGLVPRARFIGGVKAYSVKELRSWIDAGCPPRAEWEPQWREWLNRRQRRR